MKNIITKFDEFINEELKPETYLSAATKLHKLGHKNRGQQLVDFYLKNKYDYPTFITNDDFKLIFITIKPILKDDNFYFLFDTIADNNENIKKLRLSIHKPSNILYINQYDKGIVLKYRNEAVKLYKFLKDTIKNDNDLSEEEKELIFTKYFTININNLYQD